MVRKKKEKEKQVPKEPRITSIIWDDLQSGLIKRSVRDEFKAIYHFYMDSKTREMHQKMGKIRRWIHGSWAVLKGLIVIFKSVRRHMLVLSP